MQYDV